MDKKIITLCYRKIITVKNQHPWDQLVFNDSFAEFKMQAQFYNSQHPFKTFAQLLHHVPSADKLHFLVSAAVTPYVGQLNQIIPDVTNNLGKLFLKFQSFRFEIINSDLRDIEKHSIAINFYSEELNYLAQVGDYLLTSKISANSNENEALLTDMFSISPYLSIYSLKL